ncbi:PucR family transcriptional regulator ligand-binding domain-containing protein [Paenibacillus sp. P96]|uniref:PucR family transcriptional regulator ligand-binding domain-containing protein n=1 Tax=Paenibacillus zeirhizosphaerae TaxID=2987519 RepID=A0ABT9FWG1_9BACL|nr:PucR family transcriptional regulator ligand-binding domain-containing protein [Paenibacillus sp. P96]MDP4099058.1 PucR family transcriptional regulator ligand-binding domain-containing protein [Paenibacillus sp. P96]
MNGEEQLTIAEMLKRPVFHRAKLAAGERGGHRLVGWVHVLEITHISPFVSRNDLILTTGLWLKRYEEERIEYMKQLFSQGAAGLCVEFGTTIDAVPDEILQWAEEHDFPVIVFEQPVRFVEITQDIHSLLINRHHLLLKNLESFSRKLQQETLRSSDMTAILRLLYDYVSRPVVYISSIDANRFMPSIDAGLAEELEDLYGREVEGRIHADQDVHLLFPLTSHTSVLFQPVVCFGQVFSAVGIVLQGEKPGEAVSLLLDYTAKAAATLVLRTQFLEERLLRNQNELIQELINRQIRSEEQAQTRMGLRLLAKGEYLFMAGMIEVESIDKEAVQVRREAIHQDILVLLRSLLKKNNLHSLLMMKGNQCYLLCAKESITVRSLSNLRATLSDIVQHLIRYTEEELHGVRIHAGFGKSRSRVLESDQSFHEAYQVIETARGVARMKDILFYDDLGIYQMLKAVPRAPFLVTFVEDHLGALITYDQEHQMQLLDTLDMYFQCRGSKKDTADRLYIHRQTLYNRLTKITEIVGADLLSPDKRRCLEMALLAHRMLQSEGS